MIRLFIKSGMFVFIIVYIDLNCIFGLDSNCDISDDFLCELFPCIDMVPPVYHINKNKRVNVPCAAPLCVVLSFSPWEIRREREGAALGTILVLFIVLLRLKFIWYIIMYSKYTT